MKKTKSNDSILENIKSLENLVGDFMLYWGFKKIHGRIWVHLYTSNKPLDSIELMKRLKVSKGLLSIAVRELLKYHVIVSENVGRHGSVFYKANPNLIKVITDVLIQREIKMLSDTSKCLDKILNIETSEFKKHDLDQERIKNILQLTQSAQNTLQILLLQQVNSNKLNSISLS